VSDLQQQAVALVRRRGYERREEPFKLASGQTSQDYIDGKRAVDTGQALMLVSRAVVELAQRHGIVFDAVGGLTMGAEALVHGVAIVALAANHNFVNPDWGQRLGEIDKVAHWVDVAYRLGTPVVRVVGGRWKSSSKY
jgi:orotate phosphoribosyltransferase